MTARILDHDWFPAELPENVSLGAQSWLHSTYAFLHYRSRRPNGCRVLDRSGLYKTTFLDLGPDGEVEVGNYCTLVGVIISTNGRVVIRDYAFLAHDVVIADSPFATPHTGGASTGEPELIVEIGENAWIGARAILLKGARIGANAVVGAASVVDFEVPPNAVVAGNPARIVRMLS